VAADRDHGRSHVLPDTIDAVEVRCAQGDVVLVAVRETSQARGESRLGERLGDDRLHVRAPARMDARAERVVERLDGGLAVQLGDRGDEPRVAERPRKERAMRLGNIRVLVEHREAHDVPGHIEVAKRGDLIHPPARNPRPRAGRVEPEVDGGCGSGLVHGGDHSFGNPGAPRAIPGLVTTPFEEHT
jgi:hypothetical protein